MYYSEIKECDIANGPGMRVSLFVSGCRLNCKNCFNKEAQKFTHGVPFSLITQQEIIRLLEPDYIAGLSVLGGEPLDPRNQMYLYKFLKAVKVYYPQKTIWLYTGYDFEYEVYPSGGYAHVEGITNQILNTIDYIVDGRYIEKCKALNIVFRGSFNQHIRKRNEDGRFEIVDHIFDSGGTI